MQGTTMSLQATDTKNNQLPTFCYVFSGSTTVHQCCHLSCRHAALILSLTWRLLPIWTIWNCRWLDIKPTDWMGQQTFHTCVQTSCMQVLTLSQTVHLFWIQKVGHVVSLCFDPLVSIVIASSRASDDLRFIIWVFLCIDAIQATRFLKMLCLWNNLKSFWSLHSCITSLWK